jgi:hypothetical protein
MDHEEERRKNTAEWEMFQTGKKFAEVTKNPFLQEKQVPVIYRQC